MAEVPAPTPGPEKVPSGEAKPGSDGFAELRHLLVGPEHDELRALQARMDDPATHAREVSRILPEAVALRGHDPHLSKALSPAVEQAITTSVRKDPRPLADALFPVMGPAIRKAIAQALATMVESLSQALEHSLSWRALRWRWEAWRTGKPFAEVVLLNTLLYRVEHVFLIHRGSGLLLQHVAAQTAAVQADMVSGMLTAIQDWARDSFGLQEQDALTAFKIGELDGWVEQGPHAIMAAAVRGSAPRAFRLTLQDALESVHLQHAEDLDPFGGDTQPFEAARPLLESCLQVQYRKEGKAGERRVWAAAGIVLLLLGTWAFFSIRDHMRWNRYLARLRAEPGIVVVASERSGGRWTVTGLRDPLATDPQALLGDANLQSEKVEGRWELYEALHPKFVLARAKRILQPPAGVTLSVENGILAASGLAPVGWIRESRALARAIPGVVLLDQTRLEDAELRRAREAIEGALIYFVKGSTQPAAGQRDVVWALTQQIHWLDAHLEQEGRLAELEVVGHADSDGPQELNQALSAARAEALRALLPANQWKAIELSTRGDSSSAPLTSGETEKDKQRNRRVSFHLSLRAASAERTSVQ